MTTTTAPDAGSIDYEALAKAAFGAYWDRYRMTDSDWAALSEGWDVAARAVVAALRDQGLVVVPEVAWIIFMDRYANAHQNELTYSHLVVITEEEGRRIDAALAAPDDGDVTEGQSLKTSGFECCEGNGSYRVYQGTWQCQHCGECYPLDYPMERGATPADGETT